MIADLIRSAEHWERLADENEAMASWERERGIDLSAPGTSAGDYRARDYRRCAQTLRAEAETGVPHCMCHMMPNPICPWSGLGVRV